MKKEIIKLLARELQALINSIISQDFKSLFKNQSCDEIGSESCVDIKSNAEID